MTFFFQYYKPIYIVISCYTDITYIPYVYNHTISHVYNSCCILHVASIIFYPQSALVCSRPINQMCAWNVWMYTKKCTLLLMLKWPNSISICDTNMIWSSNGYSDVIACSISHDFTPFIHSTWKARSELPFQNDICLYKILYVCWHLFKEYLLRCRDYLFDKTYPAYLSLEYNKPG